MRSGDLLSAKYLLSEFKFGFELEGFLKDAYRDNEGRNRRPNLRGVFATYFPEDGSDLKGDGSLRAASEYDYPFEWSSPVLDFTPRNIGRAMNLLKNLPKHNIYTNKSCGFHVHLSFPKLKEQDAIWVLTQLSTNPEMFERITKFGNINFYSEHYATYSYIVNIAKLLVAKNWEGLRDIFTDEKYRVLRIHPQGTMEWRGPRAFLNEGKAEDVTKFFGLLREFVSWIAAAVAKPTVVVDNNVVISRSEFFANVKPRRIFPRQAGRWSADMDTSIIQTIAKNHRWLLNAEFQDANVSIGRDGKIYWHNGTWIDGVWEDGTIRNCTWKNGVWKNGTWRFGEWYGGTWENGTWVEGYFNNGEWKNGTFESGSFYEGVWHDGVFTGGNFNGGHWKKGTFKGGRFNGGTWHDGNWMRGEWRGGTWLPKSQNPAQIARQLERERRAKREAEHAAMMQKYEELISVRREELLRAYTNIAIEVNNSSIENWFRTTDMSQYIRASEAVREFRFEPTEGEW